MNSFLGNKCSVIARLRVPQPKQSSFLNHKAGSPCSLTLARDDGYQIAFKTLSEGSYGA